MNEDPIEKLRSGVVGTFQPLVDPPAKKSFAGHIQLTSDGAVIAVVASKKKDKSAKWADDPENSEVVTGITEAGTVLAPVRWTRRTWTPGDYAVAVVRWHTSSLLIDVPFDEVDGATVSAAKLRYLGLDSWSGSPDHDDEPIVEDGVGLVGWKIKLGNAEERTHVIDDDYSLTLVHDWTLTGPYENRTIHKPLKIGVTSNRRQHIGEHLARLDALHALLSVAHKKPVTATSGIVQLDPDSRRRARLWDRTMTDETIEPDTNEFPVFTLADINDLDGVAAWVTTCLAKRQAVAPIVRHRLFENQTPEARLLYTAAALEAWVASNARTHRWAAKVPKHRVPHVITGVVSDEWTNWIGDTDHWADLFVAIYNQLKHTAKDTDLEVVDALELSARWLLTASILDQCARSTRPSEQIFSRGLTYVLAKDIRDILDGVPIPKHDKRN